MLLDNDLWTWQPLTCGLRFGVRLMWLETGFCSILGREGGLHEGIVGLQIRGLHQWGLDRS